LRVEEVQSLIRTLNEHPEEVERYRAALDLAGSKDGYVVDCLAARLPCEPSRVVQEAIVSALISIGTDEVVERCAGLLRSDDAYVRNAAVEILQVLEERSLKVVQRLLEDADPDTRLLAVNVLGELRCREAVEWLRRMVAKDSEVNVVAAAVECLGEMGLREEDRKTIQAAVERFQDPYLAFAAEVALKKMGRT
jgi:HEAT repeat protein